EYEEQKRIYARGMQQIALAMQERIEAALYAKRQQAFFTVISAIVALPILLFAWVGVLGTVRKRIAERKQAVDALLESEKFFSGTLNDLLTFVGVLDPDGKVIFVNNTPIEIAGIKLEDVMGKMFYDTYWWAYSEEAQQTIKEDIERCASGETIAREIQAQMAAGSLMWIEFSMHPIYGEEGKIKYLVPEGRDITGRKQLETQLRHAQKMEAIGQLAGGVAHDFNNILTAIMSYGNILLMKMGKYDDTLRTYVDAILASSERAAALTRGLLSFSRKQIINPLPIDLNNIIKKSESLLSGVICEDIEFRTELTDKNLTIMSDRGQIEQVLMNLATNARDAMPDGGILTINTERVELDNKYIKTHGYGKLGTYVLLSVTDTGTGMDDNTRERIFEPFFTTKEVGKGTGLGLAIIYGIIKQHNGYINVYSEKGEGTTFKIYLPLIKEKIKEEKPAEAPLIGGTETVLVAEDEAPVRSSLRLILEEYGFTVIEAVNGEDAIEKFMENKEKIQLLILDVVMPKKKGKEVYAEIKKARPDIKVIFTSGYTEGTIHANRILEKGLNFISKPVLPNDLLRKIREVLDT
ncbi:MAG: ATP-binding protein, partial [Candidatus Mariimomonas ferrooxydans]